MRSRSLLSFLLISASLPVLAATTQNSPLSMNDWHVSPMMAHGETNPSYCAMAAHYTSGPVVTFTRNAMGKGTITVDFANAELQKGKRYSVSLNTGNTSQRFAAVAISGTQLVIQTGLDKKLNDSLEQGNPLSVTLDGTSGSYTLAGNTKAFFEFDHCLKALGPVDQNFNVASTQNNDILKPSPLADIAPAQQMAKIENTPVLAAPIAPIAPVVAYAAPIAPPIAAPVMTTPAPVVAYAAPVAPVPTFMPAPVTAPVVASVAPMVITPQAPSPAIIFDNPVRTAEAAPQPIVTPPSITPPPSAPAYVAPVAQYIAPVKTIQAAPVAPVQTAQAQGSDIISSESVLWDESTTAALPQANDFASIAPAPTRAVTPPVTVIPYTPVADVALPITPKIAPVEKETKQAETKPELSVSNDITNLATITPAAGTEMAEADTSSSDVKSRLKSSLAQARAEAEGDDNSYTPPSEIAQPAITQPIVTPETLAKQAKVAAPIVAPKELAPIQVIAPLETPKAIAAAPQKIETKIETKKAETKTEVKTQIAKIAPAPVIAKPVMATAPIIAPPMFHAPVMPEPETAMTADRVPLASVHASPNENDIHGLLFDNGPTTSLNKPTAYTAPTPYIAPAPIKKTAIAEPAYKAEPVKQEITPPAPAPVATQAPVTPPHFEVNEAPLPTEDVIPALPPAMPAAPARTLSVQKQPTTTVASVEPKAYIPPVPSTLNTVTPSTGHPAEHPFTQSTQVEAETQKRRSVSFTPAPAGQTSGWATRKVDGPADKKDDSFCLIENNFDNDTKLMIGQRADGYSTLGLNYGIDMLRPGKNYHVSVKVDQDFAEDFTGYAESPHTLIVQMGKKRSFFDTLPRATAMNVAMPGVASSFTLQNLSDQLDAFSSCLTGLGGSALNAPTTANAIPYVAPNPNIVPNDPVEVASLDTPKNGAVVMPTPIPDEAPEPHVSRIEKFEDTTRIERPTTAMAAIPPLPAKNVLWDTKAPAAETVIAVATPAAPVEKIDAMPQLKTDKAAAAPAAAFKPMQTADADWSHDIRTFLTQSGIQSKVAVDEKTATWSDGKVKGTAVASSETDILNAADAALTKAEKSCAGEFSSQMGVPETYGATTAQPMESKCIGTDGSTSVSTWLVRQEENGPVTAVQMEAPKDNRGMAFQMRDKMLSILKKSNMTTSLENQTEKNKSS